MVVALVRAFPDERNVVLFGDMGVHSLGNGTVDAEMSSWQARPVHAREPSLTVSEYRTC